MKIISGKYKGKKINGFDLDGTRPTMDRVKESLFAMIQMKIKNSKILDLFAGSGNLGLEALSNGAKEVTFVDKNRKAIEIVQKNIKELKVTENYQVITSDYLLFLKQNKQKYDFIFLDPPYASDYIEKAIPIILNNHLLEKDGMIICEYENKSLEFENLMIWKERKYGTKMITIYKEK